MWLFVWIISHRSDASLSLSTLMSLPLFSFRSTVASESRCCLLTDCLTHIVEMCVRGGFKATPAGRAWNHTCAATVDAPSLKSALVTLFEKSRGANWKMGWIFLGRRHGHSSWFPLRRVLVDLPRRGRLQRGRTARSVDWNRSLIAGNNGICENMDYFFWSLSTNPRWFIFLLSGLDFHAGWQESTHSMMLLFPWWSFHNFLYYQVHKMVLLYVVRLGLQRKEGTTVKLIIYADQMEQRNFIWRFGIKKCLNNLLCKDFPCLCYYIVYPVYAS